MDDEPDDTCPLDLRRFNTLTNPLKNLKRFNLLTNPLEKTIGLFQNAMNWVEGFIGSNSEITKGNLLEYKALWEDLCVIQESIIYMANEDPRDYLPRDRGDIRKKIDYANGLQKLIEERKLLLGGSYEFLDPHTATPDY